MAKNRKKEKASAEGLTEMQKKPESKSKAAPAVQTASKKPKTEAERKKNKLDGIIKTVFPAILGVIGGFACFYYLGLGTALPYNLQWHFFVLNFVLVTMIAQRALYPFLGIDVASFKGKDWFYVEFIALDLWLVSWTILSN
jgi:hypothetical protein